MDFLILKNPESIRKRLKNLFSEKTRKKRRVIVSTYLDNDASNFFPDVHGVEFFCCPQAGNIDPYALEMLQKRGAKIFFADKIHMNLYWVEDNGIIIGSASLNLSTSLWDDSNTFHELVVFFENSSKLNIDNILNLIQKEALSNDNLNDLKEKHHLFHRTFECLGIFSNLELQRKNVYHGFIFRTKSKVLCYNCYIMNKICHQN
jgi:hypothetical protein